MRPSSKAAAGAGLQVYRCRACKHHFKAVSAQPGLWARASIVVAALIAAGLTGLLLLGHDPHAPAAHPDRAAASQALAQVTARARQGDPQAEFQLGRMHWQRGDHAQAVPWLAAAAGHGHVEALYLVAVAHLRGHGTLQNYRVAQTRFTQAAEAGHLEAQYQLGLMLRDGLVSLPDKEQAYLWLNVAAARGHLDAQVFRDRLAAAMTTEQITRAQDASARVHARYHAAPAGP